MSTSPSLVLSPTLTASSYGMVSSRSRSSTRSSDNDVEDISSASNSDNSSSDESESESSIVHTSEDSDGDDFVVLGRREPRTAHLSATTSAVTEAIVFGLSSLSLTRARPAASALTLKSLLGESQPQSPSAPGTPTAATASVKASVQPKRGAKGANKAFKKTAAAVAVAAGIQGRGIVDDCSELGEEDWEEASRFITSFFANPVKSDASRLVFLQSLIVELRLPVGELPTSIRGAKQVLKAHAFVNVGEYMRTREQGQAALQRIMLPSKSALKKDIRRSKGSRVPRQVVKDHGLQVLMVRAF